MNSTTCLAITPPHTHTHTHTLNTEHSKSALLATGVCWDVTAMHEPVSTPPVAGSRELTCVANSFRKHNRRLEATCSIHISWVQGLIDDVDYTLRSAQ